MNELQKEFFERAEKERAEAEAAEEARLLKVLEKERIKDEKKQAAAKKAAEEAERKAEAEAEEIINQIKAKIDADKMKAAAEKQQAEEAKEKAEKRAESAKRFEADQKAKKAAEKEQKPEVEKAEDGDIYEREPVGEASMPKKSPKFKKGGKKSSAGKVPQRPQPQEAAATEEPKEEPKVTEKPKEEPKVTEEPKAAEEPKATEPVKDTKTSEEVTKENENPIPEEEVEVTATGVEEEVEVVEDSEMPEKATPESKAASDREAKLQEQADEWQDKYKRLLAEFENARAREAKEATRMYDVGAKAVLEKLLPVVDNFERAIQAIPEEDKERAFEQGVDKIYKQMMTTLEGIGVTPMNAEGTEFNPDLHNAVMHVEDEAYGENVVAEEMQKGYMYKDSVLRYSMVKVAN